MNIFVTDPCPIKSAKALDDKRVNKMILESAQMLCTALHLNGASMHAKYKKTHENHPCNVWARQTRDNYLWLVAHFDALLAEYTFRTGKIHACASMYTDLHYGAQFIPAGVLTPFANCAARQDMGLNFKNMQDTSTAYKLYLIQRWKTDKIMARWTSAGSPTWFSSRIAFYITVTDLLNMPAI